ncbi:MAG TPA: zinc ribbon domain-containing protein [Nannocystaceae bacterium]|nr:zinc ribbon domain-containing protein [Nannocystaceae bacterium]
MPLYAYRCTACGSEEEHIERFSDPPKATCDACGGKLERLLTPAAFHLKGGGWYKDGYASAKPSGGSGEGGGSSDSGSKSDSGSASSGSGSDSGSSASSADAGAKAKKGKAAAE